MGYRVQPSLVYGIRGRRDPVILRLEKAVYNLIKNASKEFAIAHQVFIYHQVGRGYRNMIRPHEKFPLDSPLIRMQFLSRQDCGTLCTL